MFTRRLILTVARFALFAALFAQAAVAASACLSSLSAALPVIDTQMSDHCRAQQQISLNLCLYHCTDQSDHYSQQPAVPAATVTVLSVVPAVVAHTGSRPHVPAAAATHDPPIPIRFCSFLI